MNHTTNILVLAVSYLIILLILWIAQKLRPGLISYQDPGKTDLNILSVIHLALACVMLLPTWFISPIPFFLLKFSMQPSDQQLFGLWLCLVLIIGWPRKKESDLKQHPDAFLTTQHIVIYAVSRIVFLIVYEWFFRGVLLITSCEMFGTVNAVIINILLYTLAHFHKDRKEILGCIPFGLLLCVITIWWQSIWPAVAIHVLLASRFEWRPVYHFFNLQKKAAL